MFVVDSPTIRRMDERTIASGIAGLDLMERAGMGAAERLLDRDAWLEGTTLIVCGRGNNGGDGFVVARRLHLEGHAVELLLAARAADLRGDAATNHERAVALGIPVLEMGEEPASFLRERHAASPGRLLIDGVLGTGFGPPLREPYGELAEAMGALPRRRAALDCPSGLDGSTGEADPRTPICDLTLTFGFPKWGLFLAPGRAFCGRVECIDLGFPPAIVRGVLEEAGESALYVDFARAAAWWPRRPVDAHKYSAGSLVVVGGSSGMSGAVSLACLGALRSGAGLVEAVVPGSQRLSVDAVCVEVLAHGMEETERGGLSPDSLPRILEIAGRRGAMVLGPGGGADLGTAHLFLELVEELDQPLVLDADGLNALDRLQRVPRFGPDTVLTPHTGELARALGMRSRELEARRREVVVEVAREWGVVLLHKGAPTMVAAPDGKLAVVGSGGPGLATAGSGDVLSGIVGALLAGGMPPFEAACLGAWLHGAAGDRAEAWRSPAGVLARDLLDHLGEVMLELEEAAP